MGFLAKIPEKCWGLYRRNTRKSSDRGATTPTRPQKLLNQVCDAIRCKHYASRSEEASANWVKELGFSTLGE